MRWDHEQFRKDVVEALESGRFGSRNKMHDSTNICYSAHTRLVNKGICSINLIMEYCGYFDLDFRDYVLDDQIPED